MTANFFSWKECFGLLISTQVSVIVVATGNVAACDGKTGNALLA